MLIGIIIAVIVVILLIFLWGSYNGLVNARNLVKNAWAQIDVQLKRRYDLIPNLVETVKGYKNFERDTLEAVTKARTAAQTASYPETMWRPLCRRRRIIRSFKPFDGRRGEIS